MKKLGLFVDVSNLYYCIKHKYKSKLNYRRFLDYVQDLGDLDFAIAYGAKSNDQADAFIKTLESLGFEIRYKSPKVYKGNTVVKKADWDVGITIDIVKRMGSVDIICLGSAEMKSLLVSRFHHLL